jgi:hypothetical protein
LASTLSNSEYRNLLAEIVNLKYDSIVFQANAVAVLFFGQFSRFRAARIFRQRADLPEDTPTIDLPYNVPRRRRPETNEWNDVTASFAISDIDKYPLGLRHRAQPTPYGVR